MKSFFYIFILVIISLIGFISLNNWLSENVEPIKLTSIDFIESVEKDFKTDRYKGLTIIISGYVTSIDNLSLVLDNKVFCKLLKKNINVKVGDNINVRGKYLGYDTLFDEFTFENCSIINQ